MTAYRRKPTIVSAFQLPEWVRKVAQAKNISPLSLIAGSYLVVENLGEADTERVRVMNPQEFEAEFEVLPDCTGPTTRVQYMPDGPDPNKPRTRIQEGSAWDGKMGE